MLLTETIRKISAVVRRNPTIRFRVPLSVDLIPIRAAVAATVRKRTFMSANEPRIFRPIAAEIPRTKGLPSTSPARRATKEVVRSVRLKMKLKSRSPLIATFPRPR